MPNPTLSQAIREAYASVPSTGVELHTLEIRHPAIVDPETEEPIAIRIVQAHRNYELPIEAGAPLDAGETVTFMGLAFVMTAMPIETSPLPEMELRIDNVSGALSPHLDAASGSADPVLVTYRSYLSDDIEAGPQILPPPTISVINVVASPTTVTGRARGVIATDRAFPSDVYDATRFAGLAR